MKRILITLFLLFAVSTPAFAEWGKEDTVLLILEIIDWGQTRDIATRKDIYHNRDGTEYIIVESNPILGERPSIKKVNTYFASCILLNYLIAKRASPKIHKLWNTVGIVLETYCVTHNWEMGIKIKF
jgi:hypothetical protein